MAIAISDTNPNDAIGGGGCIGKGDLKHEDCVGPYVLFPAVETDSNISPHVVLCSRCLLEAVTLRDEAPDYLSAGEPDEATAGREQEPAFIPASGPAGLTNEDGTPA